jgi:hypothetical protein
MKLLDACLALALTLAVFASSATVLVELLQMALRQRLKQLRAMLGLAFDRYLEPLLREASIAPAEIAALRAAFIDTTSRSEGAGQMIAGDSGWLTRPLKLGKDATSPAQRVTSVTVDDLFRRLSRVQTFHTVFAKIEAAALRPALEALAMGFARVEADASALFASRAHRLSYGCGIILALTVNVNAVRIFDHYASDPAGTAKTVAELTAAYASVNGTVAATGDAEKRIAATMDELRGLAAVGVPVGRSFFPICDPPAGQAQIDALCKAPLTGAAFWRHLIFWAVCVCVTGLLIGLGGPYWFDIATVLSQWRALLRGQAEGREKKNDTSAPPRDSLRHLRPQRKPRQRRRVPPPRRNPLFRP